jgi:hypothetical protein
MDRNIILEFTTDGKDRLSKITNDYTSSIESIIKERKYVPGQTAIEVTASDVEAAAILLKRGFLPKTSKYAFLSTVLDLYLIIGSIMILVGFGYPILSDLYLNSRTQFVMVFTGAMTVLLSFLMRKYIQIRESRRETLRTAYDDYYMGENYNSIRRLR